MVKKTLSGLSQAIMDLHKDLLSYQTRLVEQYDEKRYGPYEILNMSLHDSRYEWLRVLSKLIIRIDILVSEKEEPKKLELETLHKDMTRLFNGENAEFSALYRRAVVADTVLLIKQSAVTKAMQELETFLPR